MGHLRILVANEPRAYREALAGALQMLRPNTDVIAVEPPDLDSAIVRRAPQLVVCSRLPDDAAPQPLVWLVLYPDGQRRAVVYVAREQTILPDLELDGILAVVDRTAGLAQIS